MQLSIVIPTVNYTEFLDEAIQSALDVNLQSKEVLVCVNNESLEGFSASRYFCDPAISWRCLSQPKQPMWKSLNQAVERSIGRWIFLLSDDDLILPGFLEGQSLDEMDDFSLYATCIDIINEEGEFVKSSKSPSLTDLNELSPIELYFKGKFHNHLSLFVFSRVMYKKVNGFLDTGYPNGYFVDAVFHGHVLANCINVIAEQSSVFQRRESSWQGSAKFYLGAIVNEYMSKVADAFWDDAEFAKECSRRYIDKNNFLKELLYKRFFTEWMKLGRSAYGRSKSERLYLIYSYMIFWDAGIKNKIRVTKWLVTSYPVSVIRSLCVSVIRSLLGVFR